MKLTIREARRPAFQLVPACQLAGIDLAERMAVRNWTSRNLFSLKDPNPGTTMARLYSLVNVVEICGAWHMVSSGNSVVLGAKMGKLMAARLEDGIRDGRFDWENASPWPPGDGSDDADLFYGVDSEGRIQGYYMTETQEIERMQKPMFLADIPTTEKRRFPVDQLVSRVVQAWFEKVDDPIFTDMNERQKIKEMDIKARREMGMQPRPDADDE